MSLDAAHLCFVSEKIYETMNAIIPVISSVNGMCPPPLARSGNSSLGEVLTI
jgi:hypothetical protein